jgi:hypothetical protein
MSDFKSEIKSILNNHGFTESEHASVFEAMAEIMEATADQIETHEPYANVSINAFRSTSNDLSDMEGFIEEYSYKQD